MLVDFRNVGRDRKSWSADYKIGTDFERWAIGQIRKNRALLSRDIEFIQDDKSLEQDCETATIFAGVQPVGTITMHHKDEEAA